MDHLERFTFLPAIIFNMIIRKMHQRAVVMTCRDECNVIPGPVKCIHRIVSVIIHRILIHGMAVQQQRRFAVDKNQFT